MRANYSGKQSICQQGRLKVEGLIPDRWQIRILIPSVCSFASASVNAPFALVNTIPVTLSISNPKQSIISLKAFYIASSNLGEASLITTKWAITQPMPLVWVTILLMFISSCVTPLVSLNPGVSTILISPNSLYIVRATISWVCELTPVDGLKA